MEPVRILQVVTIMNRGGLETMLMNVYRQIDRQQMQFDFLVHRMERGHYDDEIEEMGGRIYRLPPIRPGSYRMYFRRLHQFFAVHPEYRIVHSHINENSGFVLGAAKRAGVPCRIAHSHLSDLGLDVKLPFRLYARYVMRGQPSHYFACSHQAGRWLFGEAHPVTVLPNAVDVEQFRCNPSVRREVREELGAGERLVIGHIGRFNKQKNHHFLLEIFHALYQKHPESMLVLAGDGPLRPVIEKKVRKFGLESHVAFLGVRKDVSRLMQGFDVFLFPSLFEGLPVVMVEAQAAGLRCIVADTITREADVSGRVEFYSLRQSAEAWADRILSGSFERRDASEELSSKGYDIKKMSRWLTEFYLTHMESGEITSLGGTGT